MELSSGIVGKWYTGTQFVSSNKVNILPRATSEGTTGYYFGTKGKKQRETFFLEHDFFFPPSQNTMSNESMGQGKYVWGKGNVGGRDLKKGF